ncbi:unnamed protein product [Linum tenue]|uniref:CCHC-type domain-containing protein n=1 Tax=Linum tenue TaxID=586396 RepID=A0AAV0MJH2_9ROSI|nr:unnamed protein product [Linum tenue]
MDLDEDAFLATFDNDQDYLKALTGGPWIILDHYLIVYQWSPSFRIGDAIPRKVTAWVRFPGLPVHFYHREVLFALGNLIGRTIKLDYHTEQGQRGKFARIAIELDMSKPLRPRIRLDGFWQKVVYENLPNACFQCGIVGHSETSCPTLNRPVVPVAPCAELLPPSSPEPPSETEAPAGFGPWMQVTRKSRKPERKQTPTQAANQAVIQGSKTGKKNQPQKEIGRTSSAPDLAKAIVGKGKSNGQHIGETSSKNADKTTKGKQNGMASAGTNIGEGDKKGNKDEKNPPSSSSKSPSTSGKQQPIALGQQPKEKGLLGPSPPSQLTSQKKEGPAVSTASIVGKSSGSTNTFGPSLEGINARTVLGPKGEAISVFDVQYSEPPSHCQANVDIPLSSLRIKNQNKKNISTGKKGVLMTQSNKALQIWSPKKEKKNKSRDKLVAITLQEIEAWSRMANENLAVPTKEPTPSPAATVDNESNELMSRGDPAAADRSPASL